MTASEKERFDQMREDIAVIKHAIVGNGTVGLHDRVIAIEGWVKLRPQQCPYSVRKAGYWTRMGGLVAVVALVLRGAEMGGRALGWW